MRVFSLLPLLYFACVVEARHPSPRWVHVCKSSNVTRYVQNKTTVLKQILRINGFDILYM